MGIETNTQIDAVLLDFSKAFDRTALGPLLFLVYINDLSSKVSSKVRLFADDCLLYRIITTGADAFLLQSDLEKLQQWESDWKIHFNTDN